MVLMFILMRESTFENSIKFKIWNLKFVPSTLHFSYILNEKKTIFQNLFFHWVWMSNDHELLSFVIWMLKNKMFLKI